MVEFDNYKLVDKGVCAAKGFKAGGINVGIKLGSKKRDLAVISCDTKCTAAAIYTQNKVKGAPIIVTKEHLKNGIAQAVIVNSGNANTCNSNGIEIAEQMCELCANELGIDKNDMSHIYNILTSQAQESGTPYRIAIEYTELYGDVIKMFFSQTNTLHVDLFCYTINGNEVDYHDFKAAKDEIFPLREVSFYGRKVYAPNTLSPLNIYYGTDWNKHYYAQWGLFTNKRMLTEEKRTPAIIDYNLIHEY